MRSLWEMLYRSSGADLVRVSMAQVPCPPLFEEPLPLLKVVIRPAASKGC